MDSLSGAAVIYLQPALADYIADAQTASYQRPPHAVAGAAQILAPEGKESEGGEGEKEGSP